MTGRAWPAQRRTTSAGKVESRSASVSWRACVMRNVLSRPAACARSEPASRRASRTPATRNRVAPSRSASAIVRVDCRSLILVVRRSHALAATPAARGLARGVWAIIRGNRGKIKIHVRAGRAPQVFARARGAALSRREKDEGRVPLRRYALRIVRSAHQGDSRRHGGGGPPWRDLQREVGGRQLRRGKPGAGGAPQKKLKTWRPGGRWRA